MDSAWSSMTGRLAGCKVATPSTNPATNTAGPTPSQASGGAQQTLNPPYLKEFPTVDQILSRLKGSSAQDTAYRQLSAFRDFAQVIAALAGPRFAQNQMTPDEIRILTNYFNAYNKLAQSVANPQDTYTSRPGFTEGLFDAFQMATVKQLWQNANNAANGQQAGTTPQGTRLPPTSDPGTLAARRCVELGGTAMQCLGGGISAGLQSLMGLNLGDMMKSGKTGLVVFGTYSSASGLHFNFADDSVDIGNCGQMIQGAHGYSLTIAGGKLAIKIDNQPQQLLVTLGTDGEIAAPALQQITGQKVTGYEVTTNLKTGAVVSRTPVYGPDTETCKMGTLSPGPATVPDQGLLADLGNAISMAGALASGEPASPSPKQNLVAPGPRFVGVFTGTGGLKIQFQDGNAVIDCSQAHAMVPYDVALQGNTASIAVKNGAAPISLTLQADGSLTGVGSATINGKLMTSMDDSGNPILTPTSATCNVDTLTAAK